MGTSRRRQDPNRDLVVLVRAGRLSEVIMDDHRPTSSGRASAAELEAGNARRESPRGAGRAERMESERGLPVQESTRDQVRRALEAAGVVFVDSDRGRGVMLLNETPCQPAPRAARMRA